MAKLDFDEKKIESVIEKLTEAKDSLTNVSDGMASGLNIIARARGSANIDTNALREGVKLPENCVIEITNMIDNIKLTAEEILKYNGDVSKMNIFERTLGTIGMFGSKLTEGVFTAGEQLIDGFASIIGWGAGLLGFKGVKESIGKFVAKDYVGDAFHNFYYNTGLGKAITKSSYIKEDGKIAGFTKGIGTAIGYAGAIYLTGGAAGVASGGTFAAGATAASSSLGVAATAAGIGGMGGTMQAGLKIGMNYNDAFKAGVKNGLLSAGTVVVLNQAIKGISNKIQANKAAKTGTSLEPAGGPTGGGSTGGPTGGATGSAGNTALNSVDDVIENTTMSAGEKIEVLQKMRDGGQITKADYARGIKATHPDTAGQSVMTEPKPTGNVSNTTLNEVTNASTKLAGETPVTSKTPSVMTETPASATQLPTKLGEAPAASNLPAVAGEAPVASNLPAVVKGSNVPAVVTETPVLPTVVSASPAVATTVTKTPVVTNTLQAVSKTSNVPAVVAETQTLPTVVTKEVAASNVPAVVAKTQTLPAVVKETPNSLVVAQNEVQLPAVVNNTSNVPAVITESAAVPAVVEPVAPVKTVVAKTPVIPVPPFTDPGTIPQKELKTTSMTLDPVSTTPISGTPASNPSGGGNNGVPSGGIPGGGTVIPTTPTTPVTTPTTPVTTPTTPQPTTPTNAPTVPPTTQPRVIPEYEPIPDTMVGKKSITDYIAPALAGAAVGVAGAVIANKRENYSAEYLDKDEDDEESHDYDDDDFFDKVEE